MNKLALQLPGFSAIPQPSGLRSNFVDLAGFITPLLEIIMFAAAFLTFYFLVWGAMAYIMAQGNKESLAKARARITYAIIGLVVILVAYLIAGYISEVFMPKGGVPFWK